MWQKEQTEGDFSKPTTEDATATSDATATADASTYDPKEVKENLIKSN